MSISNPRNLAIRQGDLVFCVAGCGSCPVCPPGAVTSGSPRCFIENLPAARVGDSASNCSPLGGFGVCACCAVHAPNFITSGSPRTFIDNRPAARRGGSVSRGIFTTSAIRTGV